MSMLKNKRKLKVFLCHAHADHDPVHTLYNRLTKDSIDTWLDKEKLLPGQDWELEIRKAVRETDVVVVCLSKQFNQAGFRQKEVRWALDTAMEQPEGEIFMIPARLEECDNLESLRKWYWVDLFKVDGYEMLMRALRARADKIGAVLQMPISENESAESKPAHVKVEEKHSEIQRSKTEMSTELHQKISEFIVTKILKQPKRVLRADETLISSGLIDSFSLVDLALFVEDTFGVRIADSELNATTFDSIEQLVNLIVSRQKK